MATPFSFVDHQLIELVKNYLQERGLTANAEDFPLGLIPYHGKTVDDKNLYRTDLRAGRAFIFLQYQDIDGNLYLDSDNNAYQLMRFLTPPINWYGKEPPPKALAPTGRGNELHFEPIRVSGRSWRSLPGNELVVHVESMIKAKCVHKHTGIAAIGYNGVWSFSNKGGILHSKYDFAWADYEHIILFDSNIDKEGVKQARDTLLFKMATQLGCKKLKYVDLPKRSDGTDQGPDDYVVENGGDALLQFIMEQAKEYVLDPHAHMVADMNKEIYYLTDSSNIVVRKSKVIKGIKDIENDYKNRAVPEMRGKNIIKVYPFKEWMESANRNQVDGVVFDYLGDELVTQDNKTMYNVYMPSGIHPGPEVPGWDKVLGHLQRMMSPEDLELFRSYLKYVRFTNGKPTSLPVLHSNHRGVGKGWFCKLMKGIMGANGKEVKASVFESDFNSQLKGVRLVICNEFAVKDRKVAERNLKNMVGDDELEIEAKYQNPYTINNQLAFVFTCNDPSEVPSDGLGDRRLWYVNCDGGRVDEESYWDDLHSLIKDKGVLGAFASWVESGADMNFASWRPPATAEREEILSESLSGLEQGLLSLRNDMMTLDDKPMVFSGDLIRHLLRTREVLGFAEDVSAVRFGKALAKTGWLKSRSRYSTPGGGPLTLRYYYLIDEEWNARDNIAIHAELARVAKLLGVDPKF